MGDARDRVTMRLVIWLRCGSLAQRDRQRFHPDEWV